MPNGGWSFLDNISRKSLERVLGAITLLVVIGGGLLYGLDRPPVNSVNEYVAVNADGSFESQSQMSYVWRGATPLNELTYGSSQPVEEERWFDGKGRLLEVKTEPIPTKGFKRTVLLQEPVFPKERVDLKAVTKSTSSIVKREGNDYVFRTIPNQGMPCTLSYTLKLPAGATVLSTQPEIDWRCEEGDRTILRFKWVEKRDHHPELIVKYSLPQG